MADMFDNGNYTFTSWSKQNPAPNGKVFLNRWLGEFNPKMSGKEANKLLDHVGKITLEGQRAFIRGWKYAQNKYRKSN